MGLLVTMGKWLAGLIVLTVAALALWLSVSPPDLIRVASNYSAKIVCSNVFVAGRDAQDVLALDVQAPGHPILKLISVSVDAEARTVSAGLFGVFGGGLALARDGYGCVTVPDGDLAAVPRTPAAPSGAARMTGIWPQGIAVEPSQDADILRILDDPAMTGPGMRAVVVVQNGRIVGERYGKGFSSETPLLGWSMTKSVTAAIVGTLVRDGRLSVDQKGLFDAWKADGRADIALSDLMAMSSGLEFNEDYGDVTDVTRMLYLEPDMASFAAAKPLTAGVGDVWNYSTGTTVLVSQLWQQAVGAEALVYPWKALFDPLGMTTARIEIDARGTFVGSSYLYASARDWARFGLFMLQGGVWNGQQILPPGYVDWLREAAPASNGEYGKHVWLHGPSGNTPPGQDPDAGFDLPDDAFWFLGHDGQSVALVPSKNLVVVRLGLTPSKLDYKPQAMLAELVRALP
ncbi:MAG: serine hydrolase domain-containing protein [Rhizobiaceae bacterium]